MCGKRGYVCGKHGITHFAGIHGLQSNADLIISKASVSMLAIVQLLKDTQLIEAIQLRGAIQLLLHLNTNHNVHQGLTLPYNNDHSIPFILVLFLHLQPQYFLLAP